MGDHTAHSGDIYGTATVMTGRIVKGIGGFYYVHTGTRTYTCRAKGIFRLDGTKPLVGDMVDIDVIDDADDTGNITGIRERSNELIRPMVANVDQAVIIFALTDPAPNFLTLDKMILQYKAQGIPVLICFNKEDIVKDEDVAAVLSDYRGSGCGLFVTSAKESEGVDELKTHLAGRTSVVAGPSGAGKSSLINCLTGSYVMQTGEISEKLLRGKHTTRHSEIIPIGEDTYIIDTPGFGSFELNDIRCEDLSDLYAEFNDLRSCRFRPCSHVHEPDCAVRSAVEDGLISRMRYDDYVYIYTELSKSRRY